MMAHREPDPEGDPADAKWENPFGGTEDTPTCSACGSPLDEDDDCPNADCSRSPYHLDEEDELDDEEPDA